MYVRTALRLNEKREWRRDRGGNNCKEEEKLKGGKRENVKEKLRARRTDYSGRNREKCGDANGEKDPVGEAENEKENEWIREIKRAAEWMEQREREMLWCCSVVVFPAGWSGDRSWLLCFRALMGKGWTQIKRSFKVLIYLQLNWNKAPAFLSLDLFIFYNFINRRKWFCF